MRDNKIHVRVLSRNTNGELVTLVKLVNYIQASNEFLLELKNKHTKSAKIEISSDIKEYLKTSHLTTQEKQTLFQLRTRVFQCKANFSYQFDSLVCDFCDEIDKQEHLLQCTLITDGIDLNGVKYEHIFGKLPDQIKSAKVLKLIADKRKSLSKLPSITRKPGASSQMPHILVPS